MFKDKKINSIAKLFCLIMYSIVIIFLKNNVAFILLFGYYLFKIFKNPTFASLFICFFILLGLAMNLTDNITIVVKLSLFIAFFHYFLNDIIKSLKEENKEEKEVIVIENEDKLIINKEDISKENKELLDKELKKGTVIKEEDKDKIIINLNDKDDIDYKEKLRLKLERFYNKKKVEVKKINDSFDYYSTMYVAFKLVILVIVIMVD